MFLLSPLKHNMLIGKDKYIICYEKNYIKRSPQYIQVQMALYIEIILHTRG